MGALTVTVRSGARRTSYPIRIGRGLASSLGRSLAGLAGADRPIVVSSPRVWAAVGPRVEPGLPGVSVVLVPDGERAKHLWVGEPAVRTVLGEIVRRVNPAAWPLPTEWEDLR